MMPFPWVVEPGAMPGFVIRATVVLGTGLVLAWLLRRKSALIRHRLWTVTLFILLLLPPLTLWAPQWQLPLLPPAADARLETEVDRMPAPPTHATPVVTVSPPITASGVVRPQASAVEGPTGSIASAGLASSMEPPDEQATAESARGPGTRLPAGSGLESARRLGTESLGGPGLEPASGAGTDPAGETGTTPARGFGAEPPGLQGGDPASPPGSFPNPMLLWAIGCLAGLASLAAGHLRFHRLVRSAHPLRGPLWRQELEAARHRLGLRGDVRLLVSEAAGTPMTGGFRKPAILLPASASTWDSERRQVVLTHELVHVHHRDAFRQLMGGVVLALYWFHPLSWLACRLAAISREEACDERVLELGSRPSQYARHLMSLAAGTTSARLPVAALSMARQSPSRLEKRIMAILRPRRPRTSALVSGALLAVTGLLGLSTAIAHPVARERADAPVNQADASGTQADRPSSREIGEENPAAAVAAADRKPEARATGTTAVETGESAGGGAAEGRIEDAANGEPALDIGDGVPLTGAVDGERSAVSGSPGILTAGDDPDAPRRVDSQEVNCYPPSAGREDPGDPAPGSAPAFNVRTTVPIGITRQGEDRFAVTFLDEVRLCMRLHGEVDLGSSGIPDIAADGWILLESARWWSSSRAPASTGGVPAEVRKLHRLTLRPAGEAGGLEDWWHVDGENRPFDEAAREWRDGMLSVLRGLMEIDRIRREEAELEDRISRLLGAAPGLAGQANRDRGIVAGLQSQVAYRESVVADLLNRISYHQGVLSAMRDEIAYHRSVVSGMRDEIAMHRGRVAAFQDVKSSHEARITALIPRLKTADSAQREAIDRSIKSWEELIKEIDGQIEAYGLRGKVGKIEARIRDYGLGATVQTLEQQISAYELSAGFRQIEAAIAEETARLDDVTRRAEQAIRARDSRTRDTGQEIAVSTSPDSEVARLEQQLRDLDADETVAMIEQLIEDVGEELLELIRRL